jgi:hypothetical protein
MNRFKMAGIIGFTGIWMWYIGPWFGDLVSPDCACNDSAEACLEGCVDMDGDACNCNDNDCGCPACVTAE